MSAPKKLPELFGSQVFNEDDHEGSGCPTPAISRLEALRHRWALPWSCPPPTRSPGP